MRTTLRSLWLLLATLVSFSVLAAPKAELWSFWDKQGSSTGISHQAWQDILDKYLVTEGEYTLFRYGQVSKQDKSKLQSYLMDLSNVDPRTYTKPEQYAYWVNLYNALTVDLIIKEYPVKSITKLGGLFSFGPWDQELITVQGKKTDPQRYRTQNSKTNLERPKNPLCGELCQPGVSELTNSSLYRGQHRSAS